LGPYKWQNSWKLGYFFKNIAKALLPKHLLAADHKSVQISEFVRIKYCTVEGKNNIILAVSSTVQIRDPTTVSTSKDSEEKF